MREEITHVEHWSGDSEFSSSDSYDKQFPFTMSLFGYTSTSVDKNSALKFAKGDEATGMKPVLYIFQWAHPNNYYLLDMSPY